MTLLVIQGHNCISNFTNVKLCYNSRISDSINFKLWHPNLACGRRIMLMLVSMTLTLMQGHSGSAKIKIQCWIISTSKQSTSIKLATTVGHFFTSPWLWKRLYGLTICFSLPLIMFSTQSIVSLNFLTHSWGKDWTFNSSQCANIVRNTGLSQPTSAAALTRHGMDSQCSQN